MIIVLLKDTELECASDSSNMGLMVWLSSKRGIRFFLVVKKFLGILIDLVGLFWRIVFGYVHSVIVNCATCYDSTGEIWGLEGSVWSRLYSYMEQL